MCKICNDKRYITSKRMSGRKAIERCDSCSYGALSDEEAARLARADGIECAETYPCFLLE